MILSFSISTFFVVTSPEALHAGIPTSLAVTVIADFPGKVVAEVAQGNTKVFQTNKEVVLTGGDATDMLIFMLFIMIFHFKGTKFSFPPCQGSTGVITLPPVSF